MTSDDVKATLDSYVERRNRIVHSGDTMPGGTATRPIQFDFVLRGGTVIEAVGEAVFEAVSSRVREVR
jgi:hypothetical protein